MSRISILQVIALSCLISTPSLCQTPELRSVTAKKLVSPPTIDGDLADPQWSEAPILRDFKDRFTGGTSQDQTEVRIAFDSKFIYVAFLCRDSQPSTVTARETNQDHKYANLQSFTELVEKEDNVEIVLDPFRSHKLDDLTFISVNAIGTRSLRIGGGRAAKREWKGDWQAAVKRNADGWSAEMAIPWEMLNYPAGKGPSTFGLNFTRFQLRTQTRSEWSSVGPENFYERMGTWEGVEPPTGVFRPKLSLLPYAMTGMVRNRAVFRSGIDARYTIAPELTAVATINPDFATVEGAVEGIQFSRQERYVPERRPFFLEGADYLNTPRITSIGDYFFSRRIETVDVGAKVYGKVTGKDTLGVLATSDINNSNVFAGRWRRDLSPTSDISLILNNRSGSTDNNSVGAISQSTRWGKFELGSELALTGGRDSGGRAGQIVNTYTDKNTLLGLIMVDIGRDFRVADGFIPFVDNRGFIGVVQWLSEWRNGPWRGFKLNMTPVSTWHQNGLPFIQGSDFNLMFDTRDDHQYGVTGTYQSYDGQQDRTLGLVYKSGISNRFRQWGLEFNTGVQGGSPSTYVAPSFSVRVLRKLDIAYAGAVLNLQGSTQQHIITAQYEFSPTRSIGGRVVVNNSNTNYYFSYRNSGALGTEVYFIIGDPNAERFKRQALVKFVFAR